MAWEREWWAIGGGLSASFTEDVAAEMTLEVWDRVMQGWGGGREQREAQRGHQ